MKRRWPAAVALEVAREMVRELRPVAVRLVVAGSLRRRRADVGDVEIVYVPRMEERAVDFFEMGRVSLADEEIGRMMADGTLSKRESRSGGHAWGDQNKLAVHRDGIPVDLFCTTEEAWWNYLVCRTGPAALNTRIAMEAQRRGFRWNPYGAGFVCLADGQVRAMGSEREVFEFVGMEFLEAWERR